MKKNRSPKYPQSLNRPKLNTERNPKTKFRHQDRGIHSGRVRGK